MVCGTVQLSDTSTLADGVPMFVQNPNRTDWGMAFPPGRDSLIGTPNAHQSYLHAMTVTSLPQPTTASVI